MPRYVSICGRRAFRYKTRMRNIHRLRFFPDGRSSGRLTNISSVLSDSSVINSFSYTLDSLGRRIARADADNSQTSWKYDSYDQLTNAVRSGSPNPATDAAYNFGYQFDQVGNRLHEDRGQLDLDGTHNNLNQLTHLAWQGKLDVAGSVSATNPPVSVLVNGASSTLYTNVSPTQFLGGASVQAGSNTISIVTRDTTSTTETTRVVHMPPSNPQLLRYDLNGNLTTDSQKAYFWDEENRLVAIESLVGPHRRSEYSFDGMGRRIQTKDLTGWTGSAYATTNTTRYVWDGWLLLAELDATNAFKTYQIWGLDLSQSLQGAGGIGGLLGVARGPPGGIYLFTFDGNGNVADVLQVSNLSLPPSVVASYQFDPFGRLVSSSGSFASSNRWLFSTKQFDSTWGLSYFGLRFYSPGFGRWLNRDPIECRFRLEKSRRRPTREALPRKDVDRRVLEKIFGFQVSDRQFQSWRGDVNEYDFCQCSPVNGVDPDGQLFKEAVIVVLIVAVAYDVLVQPYLKARKARKASEEMKKRNKENKCESEEMKQYERPETPLAHEPEIPGEQPTPDLDWKGHRMPWEEEAIREIQERGE